MSYELSIALSDIIAAQIPFVRRPMIDVTRVPLSLRPRRLSRQRGTPALFHPVRVIFYV